MALNTTNQTGLGKPGSDFSRAVRECLASGVLLVEPGGQAAVLSPQAAAVLGLTGAAECRVDNLPITIKALAHEVMSSGRPAREQEFELRVEGRGLLVLRVSAVPVRSEGGVGAALVLTDVSSAVACEQRLEQMDRLANLGTLVASTAHEIRNALVAGKTFLDLLLEKNREAELSEIVQREMARIDAIVSRLLKFAGPDNTTIGPVHLHEVLDYSLRLLHPQFESKAIVVERAFHAAGDVVNGNESSLQQAFVNLMLNSAEAMDQKGKLKVTTESLVPDSGRSGGILGAANSSDVRVIIEDTGMGISAENMPRLFEPFFTTKPAGTGLGLAITQRIIHEHRGKIDVESQPAQGAAFIVTLRTWPEADIKTRDEAQKTRV
jgi:two-component system sensor histidine kinase AtoS